jgi:hypothetical protein
LKALRSSWRVVREHRRPYIVLNGIYYGLVISGMMYVAFFNPALQEQLITELGGAFVEGPLAAVGSAYLGGSILTAALLTFVVNLLGGSLLVITLPSLVIPFSGLAIGCWRAVLWGLALAPTSAQLALVMIPHSLVLLLEGQAYILTMLAVYVHGMAFLRPHSVGLTSHGRGYVAGLRLSARLYLLVIVVLGVAAIYEALEVILIVRLASGLG